MTSRPPQLLRLVATVAVHPVAAQHDQSAVIQVNAAGNEITQLP